MNDYSNVSAIILSGGKSSRMGTDKCDLVYNGKTLLNIQIEKMKQVGISDIIASGYKGNNCETKIVDDDILKGPLSGILKGLEEIKNDRAFVVSVDVPLLKIDIIKKIIDYSLKKNLDIVMVKHYNTREPLIGVYKKNLISRIKNIISGDKYSVMKLADVSSYEFLNIDEDDKYFFNVNYKDDYNKLLEEK